MTFLRRRCETITTLLQLKRGCSTSAPTRPMPPGEIYRRCARDSFCIWTPPDASSDHAQLVKGSLEEAQRLMTELLDDFNDNSAQVTRTQKNALAALKPFYKPQWRNEGGGASQLVTVGKAQLQIPLAKLLRRDAVDGHDDLLTTQFPKLLELAQWMSLVGTGYLTALLRPHLKTAVGRGVLDNMEKRSVLRLWHYKPAPLSSRLASSDQVAVDSKSSCHTSSSTGASMMDMGSSSVDQGEHLGGCRAHFDPGLTTILLGGTQPGLELYAPKTDEWVPARVASTTLEAPQLILLSDTTLRHLTAGVVKDCLHRVVAAPQAKEGEEEEPQSRVNIILEIRPKKNQWYDFQLPVEERASLEQWMANGE